MLLRCYQIGELTVNIRIIWAIVFVCVFSLPAISQVPTPGGNGVGPQLITVGGGPGNIEQQVAALDFAQIMLQKQAKNSEEAEKRRRENQELVSFGRDLGA